MPGPSANAKRWSSHGKAETRARQTVFTGTPACAVWRMKDTETISRGKQVRVADGKSIIDLSVNRYSQLSTVPLFVDRNAAAKSGKEIPPRRKGKDWSARSPVLTTFNGTGCCRKGNTAISAGKDICACDKADAYVKTVFSSTNNAHWMWQYQFDVCICSCLSGTNILPALMAVFPFLQTTVQLECCHTGLTSTPALPRSLRRESLCRDFRRRRVSVYNNWH